MPTAIVRHALWSICVGILISGMLGVQPALAERSDVRVSLKLVLNVRKGGAVAVRQIYTFAKESKFPKGMKTWIPGATRNWLLYRDLGLGPARVFAAQTLPVPFDTSRTPNGMYISIDKLTTHFDRGPIIEISYVLTSGIRAHAFRADFFGHDTLLGTAGDVQVEVHWDAGTGGPLAADMDVVSEHVTAVMALQEQHGHMAVYRVPYHKLALPIELRVRDIRFGPGQAESMNFPAVIWDTIWSNLWLFLPLLVILGLLAWARMLIRRRSGAGVTAHPSPKPPSGMDPATLAGMMYGGFSSRAFAASILWLAHREKITLEHRAVHGHPMDGLLISQRGDPDTTFKDYERMIWSNIIFEAVESISMARLRGEVHQRARHHRLRRQFLPWFPASIPLRHPDVREWWLWPETFRGIALGVLGFGLLLIAGAFGLLVPGLAKPEWILTWPMIVGAGIIFTAVAPWHRGENDRTTAAVNAFLAFLDQPPERLRELQGRAQAFSFLLPYAIAAGVEHNLLDAYCLGRRNVPVPSWFMIHGATSETIHVNVVRDLLGDTIEGLLRVF